MQPIAFPQPMPADPSINELFMRVMAEHGVTQRTLAEFIGCDRVLVTRMCNATSAVTLDAIRILYKLTHDPRLAGCVVQGQEAVVLDLSDAEITRCDIDLATLLIALNGVQAQAIEKLDSVGGDCPQFVREIDTAIKHLLRVRRRVAAKQPIPFRYRQAKRLPDPLTA